MNPTIAPSRPHLSDHRGTPVPERTHDLASRALSSTDQSISSGRPSLLSSCLQVLSVSAAVLVAPQDRGPRPPLPKIYADSPVPAYPGESPAPVLFTFSHYLALNTLHTSFNLLSVPLRLQRKDSQKQTSFPALSSQVHQAHAQCRGGAQTRRPNEGVDKEY